MAAPRRLRNNSNRDMAPSYPPSWYPRLSVLDFT